VADVLALTVMLSLALSSTPETPPAVEGSATSALVADLQHAKVQARRRRVCATAGIKCDTIPCCRGLKCVEEIVGKVCRSKKEEAW
jgi:hypothetical protein